jgi:hypothetical protein
VTLADDLQAWTLRPRLAGRTVDPDAIGRRCVRHPEYVGSLTGRYVTDLRMRLRRAERIVLEDDFVRNVVNISAPEGRVSHPLVEKAMRLARAPFTTTWIEWDARASMAEQVALGTLAEVPGNTRPEKLGYLIESSDDGSRWKFQEFCGPPPDKSWADSASPALVRGGLSTEPLHAAHPHLRRTPSGVRVDVNSPLNRATILLGAASTMISWEPLNQVALDLDELGFGMIFDITSQVGGSRSSEANSDMIRGIENDVRELGGSLRFIVFALALINTASIAYDHQPAAPGRNIGGGRSVPYLDHRTVRIQVPSGTRHVTRYLTTTLVAAHRRAHQVRGHWRAAHVWRGKPRPRRWIEPHVRGDASLGWVNQDHVVTT